MLLESGRVVSTDYLVDAIWDESPPGTARTQVQICVSRLRKSLAPTDATLVTQPPGYLLRADADAIDARRSERLAAEAEVVIREGRDEEAAILLRKAAELWRGPTLSGISSRSLSTKATRLDESRTSLIETYLDLELGLGLHHRLIGEITALVEEFPLRERLRGQLMVALYRSGRQAEALETYRRGRDLLIDELGLEPGEELRDLESAILSADPSLLRRTRSTGLGGAPTSEPSAAPGRTEATTPDLAEDTANEAEPRPVESRPRQLPADSADFVGRDEWVGMVESTLTMPERGHAVGVAVVIGRPGVGKSAMAVHVAHRLAEDRFPDGQLYCDLRGSRDNPIETTDVLARFLRALGIPGQAIPEGHDERAEMYRSLLSDRRVLVVLDDAGSERQVGDLLPGNSGCGVIVTSRARLTGVPGAVLAELDVLEQSHSLDLLRRIVGANRVDGEPAAAEALVRSVGRLPLALRIVAARLAARPHWSLASMVNRLSDERHRLDELTHGELGVRASLSLTYDGMDELTRRSLRLFALAEGPSQPGWLAGALLDDRRLHPSDLLEPLVDAQMLDVTGIDTGGDPRYRYHDIIRLFARERLYEQESETGRLDATGRLVGGWLSLVDEANRRIHGGDYLLLHGQGPRWRPPRRLVEQLLTDPMDWFEGEQDNLYATVDIAAAAGLDELCWDLAVSLLTLFSRRCHLDEWAAVNRSAMAVVRAADNRRGIAALTFSYGCLYLDQRRNDEAKAAMTSALESFTDLGDALGRAKCLRELAHLANLDGDRHQALEYCSQAYTIFESIGDIVGMGRALLLSGHLHMSLGDEAQGMACLVRAREYAEATGDPRSRAQVMRRLGQYALLRGEHREALRILSESFELVRELRDPIGEGYLLHDLGRVSGLLGRTEEARGFLGRSLAVREQIRDREGRAEVGLDLALLLAGLGERGQATELAEHAAGVFEERGMDQKLAEAERIIDASRS